MEELKNKILEYIKLQKQPCILKFIKNKNRYIDTEEAQKAMDFFKNTLHKKHINKALHELEIEGKITVIKRGRNIPFLYKIKDEKDRDKDYTDCFIPQQIDHTKVRILEYINSKNQPCSFVYGCTHPNKNAENRKESFEIVKFLKVRSSVHIFKALKALLDEGKITRFKKGMKFFYSTTGRKEEFCSYCDRRRGNVETLTPGKDGDLICGKCKKLEIAFTRPYSNEEICRVCEVAWKCDICSADNNSLKNPQKCSYSSINKEKILKRENDKIENEGDVQSMKTENLNITKEEEIEENYIPEDVIDSVIQEMAGKYKIARDKERELEQKHFELQLEEEKKKQQELNNKSVNAFNKLNQQITDKEEEIRLLIIEVDTQKKKYFNDLNWVNTTKDTLKSELEISKKNLEITNNTIIEKNKIIEGFNEKIRVRDEKIKEQSELIKELSIIKEESDRRKGYSKRIDNTIGGIFKNLKIDGNSGEIDHKQ